jgi:nitroimidazol reductase NimA-like FMN-containing flavoprotein (pyridoxamine 5'-phosphate oxidase superfamily)
VTDERPADSAGEVGDELWDPGSLDELDSVECWRLLATLPVGRVAVVVGHYASVFPVNYALDGRSIVFRTGAGAKLWALDRSNVTFEADDIDVEHQGGWSVMIKGTGQEVSVENNPNLAARSQAAGAAPWAPGPRSRLVRIVADQITGRRIRPGAPPPPT